jgi:hypothetical protein
MADLVVSSDVDDMLDSANAAAIRTSIAAVGSVTAGITGATAITNIVAISQADYDDIVSPSASTFYVITD